MANKPTGEGGLAWPREREVPVQYPESSELPGSEDSRHSSAVISLRNALEHHFRNRPDVFVSGRLGIWVEDGTERGVVQPDVIVTLATLRGERGWYYVWVEGKPPDFACDVISGAFGDDWEYGPRIEWGNIGIPETLVYDPGYNGAPSRMRMRRLEHGDYVDVAPNERGEFESRILGLGFQPDGDKVRVRNLESGKLVPTMSELARGLRLERRARRAEATARRDAEQRVAELEALIESPS